MPDDEYEQWLAGLTIREDEAYLPGEKAPRPYRRSLTEEQRRNYYRDRSRRRREQKDQA